MEGATEIWPANPRKKPCFQKLEYQGKTRGVLPEKLGGGVRPASQNPYTIYDQNLQYSLPYLWPDF